ncbi:MAG: 50S ribosomal protein L10 [Candidatus Altiarchaeales archaeon]|nr:50S ribosomal protein L10 [Candidatus Altiarchaeales archaeon]
MVAPRKFKEVDELAEKMAQSKAIALINIEGIPSKQFQIMRKNLAGKVEVRISKNTLMARALDKASVKDLEGYIQGSAGLVFTNLSPVKLNRILKENRVSAYAKEGDIAPRNIIVPAGGTSLAPGPIISDLQNAGVKAKIEGGKIVVTKDSVVVKKGEVIDRMTANVLSRLGVEPMEIGVDLSAVYEDGLVYGRSVLDVDEETVLVDITSAHQNAFNLALNAGVINAETISPSLQKAFSDSLNLALNADVINAETIKLSLSKANRQMLSLALRIPEGVDEDIKSLMGSVQVKEQDESPVIEKKEEIKDEKSEEDSEEGAAAGLASLFG